MGYARNQYPWNMKSHVAMLGRKQAAMDYLDEILPSCGEAGQFLSRIKESCFNYRRPSAWWRGYLLIPLVIERIDLAFADRICRQLSSQNLETVHFPRIWLDTALRECCDPMLFVIEAAEYMSYPGSRSRARNFR